LLLEAKAALKHGEWLPWLKAHVAFSERTAQAYMRLASGWDRLKSATAADLGLRDALALLREPGQPRQADTVEVLSDEDEAFLAKLRAAGGCEDLAEYDRLTSIQRRLLGHALEQLNGAIADGLEDFTVEELKYAHERLTDCLMYCAQISESTLDFFCGLTASEFKEKAEPLLGECNRRIRKLQRAA
jgi:hypothetical protein